MQCPEPDRIAAYLEDKLFEEERRILEEHFAACEDCWQVFSNAVEYIAERRPGQVAGVEPGGERTVTRGIWAQRNKLTSVAALLALSLGGWWLVGESRAGQVAAVEERPILPRLSGESWGPRPEGPYRSVGTLDLTRVAYMQRLVNTTRAADARSGAAQLQTLGRDYLLAGSADDALRALQRAVAAAPDDAGILSDLAAAYLDRGLANANSHDVAQSIEIASTAREANPALPAARFNLALAFEALPLPAKAAEAWKAYLDVDRESGWAEEARSRLRELEQRAAKSPPLTGVALRAQIVRAAAAPPTDGLARLVADHRQEARETFLLDLLPAWSEAALAGDATAAERLASAGRLAAVWQEQTDDRSLQRQVDEIALSGGADRGRFARGHRALAKGMAALDAMEVNRAAAALGEAQRELPAESAARAWADLSALACEFYRLGPDDTVVEQFDALVSRTGEDEPFRAHLSWLRGVLQFRRGEPQALSLLADALAAFEHLDEVDHVTLIHYLLADAHALFGDMPRAWAHRRHTLAAIPGLSHPDRAFELLLAPAIAAAYFEERPRLAAALLDELALLRNPRPPHQAAELELWRSRIEARLGRFGKARAALASGSAWAWRVDDPPLRRQLVSGLQAASSLVATSDPSAIATLSASIERGRATPDFQFPRLLLERARRYRKVGELARAAADLREGIAWLQRPASAAPVDALYSRRLVGGNDLFNELTALQLEHGDDAAAFASAEDGRRWALRGEVDRVFSAAAGDEDRPTIRALQRRLEPKTVLLSFSLLGEKAILWRVDAAGSSMTRLSATPLQLQTWGTQLQTELSNGEWTERARQAARLLYEALIAPAQLDGRVSRLVIVPDVALDQLPFAALVDGRGRFLVEKVAIEVSPSAGSFLTARERARQLGQEEPSVLALGDPRVGSQLRPELQPLPAAAEEARVVARQYKRRELLVEQHATKNALLERAGRHSVVHFAGHALANPIDPARSSLALAPTPGGTDTGALFAFEVSSARFTRTRLVVLAGCDTGAGPQRAGEGTASLARAFLAAEVPAVVASLWPVNDARTAELMTRLHERVARGEDPAAALRAAQLTMLHAKDPALRSPSTWAAFGLLGG